MTPRCSIYLVILLFAGQVALAQGFGPAGFAYKVGFSTSAKVDPKIASAPTLDAVVPSTAVSLFVSWRFAPDSSWRPFSDLKFSLGPGFRGGVFDVNGSPTHLSMAFIDLEIVLPAKVPISENLNLQFGIGPQLAFKILQTENTPKAETFQPGIITEWGIGTHRGSFLGFSVARSFTTYDLTNVSFMFALSSGEMSRKQRK